MRVAPERQASSSFSCAESEIGAHATACVVSGLIPPHTSRMSFDDEEPREERTNLLLRTLINEMLEQVREIQRQSESWPADERQQAEEALDRIMSQVRSQAAHRGEA